MSYEIPRNLTKYAEEFLFGLSLKQFGYALGSLVLCFLIYIFLEGTVDRIIIFLIVLPLIVLGILFTFFDLDVKIKAYLNLRRCLYKASYFDTHLSSFIDVDQIRDDVVILKNGSILGILEIMPIDFFILSSQEKNQIVQSYHHWLRSINYHVQILSRSVALNIEPWLSNISKHACSTDASRAEAFSVWMREQMTTSTVRDRRFYIIIPQVLDVRSRGVFHDLKSIFTGDYKLAQNEQELVTSITQLRNNILNCQDTLEKCTIDTRRLKTVELLGLYSSYFRNQSKVNNTFLSPLIWMDEKLEKKVSDVSPNISPSPSFQKAISSGKIVKKRVRKKLASNRHISEKKGNVGSIDNS